MPLYITKDIKKMRLKEPFRGIYTIGGHTLFHVALLTTSLILLQFPEPTDANEDFLYTVNVLRIAHAVNLIFGIFKFI